MYCMKTAVKKMTWEINILKNIYKQVKISITRMKSASLFVFLNVSGSTVVSKDIFVALAQ